MESDEEVLADTANSYEEVQSEVDDDDDDLLYLLGDAGDEVDEASRIRKREKKAREVTQSQVASSQLPSDSEDIGGREQLGSVHVANAGDEELNETEIARLKSVVNATADSETPKELRKESKLRGVKRVFDVAMLLGEKGLPALHDIINRGEGPSDTMAAPFAACLKRTQKRTPPLVSMLSGARGDEQRDLQLILGALERWAHAMFPPMAFNDVIERLEVISRKKPVQAAIMKYRQVPLREDLTGNEAFNFVPVAPSSPVPVWNYDDEDVPAVGEPSATNENRPDSANEDAVLEEYLRKLADGTRSGSGADDEEDEQEFLRSLGVPSAPKAPRSPSDTDELRDTPTTAEKLAPTSAAASAAADDDDDEELLLSSLVGRGDLSGRREARHSERNNAPLSGGEDERAGQPTPATTRDAEEVDEEEEFLRSLGVHTSSAPRKSPAKSRKPRSKPKAPVHDNDEDDDDEQDFLRSIGVEPAISTAASTNKETADFNPSDPHRDSHSPTFLARTSPAPLSPQPASRASEESPSHSPSPPAPRRRSRPARRRKLVRAVASPSPSPTPNTNRLEHVDPLPPSSPTAGHVGESNPNILASPSRSPKPREAADRGGRIDSVSPPPLVIDDPSEAGAPAASLPTQEIRVSPDPIEALAAASPVSSPVHRRTRRVRQINSDSDSE